MNLREEHRDLLSVPQGYYLAHCINGNFKLGVGLAAAIDEAYNMAYKLDFIYKNDSNSYVGKSLLVDNVFNLVTKVDRYTHPTYTVLRSTLEDMRDDMATLMATKVAMPRIGCGKDRLDWGMVLNILTEVFKNTDVEILICNQ